MVGVCKHGHPRTPENTYTRPNGRQLCRPCAIEHSRAWRSRNGIRPLGWLQRAVLDQLTRHPNGLSTRELWRLLRYTTTVDSITSTLTLLRQKGYSIEIIKIGVHRKHALRVSLEIAS